jgi:serine/threonine protein kinase
MMDRDGTDSAAAAATAEIGSIIDKRYRITGVLGTGGMGSVYRGEHIKLRRPVAVKMLHAHFSQTSEASKRFEREAFAAGRLDHPNCVTVSDFGELDDGTLYLVMELIDGLSLEDLLERDGRLSVARALHITGHVLRGLGHAHQMGIVHRDIKPGNVILVERDDDTEFARLLDFGIAKLMGEAATEEGGKKLTQAGMAFGTPLYLSPEQAIGGRVDHRADLYSTSVMLFQMVTGVVPFDSEEPLDVLMAHATREVPRIAEMAPGVQVPEDVEQLIRRGMAKKAGQRFVDATEYLSEIERCLAASSAPRPAVVSSSPTEVGVHQVSVSADDTQPGFESPPSESPPVESPPVESPPVESPPVESPPVEALTTDDASVPMSASAETTPAPPRVVPLQAALTGALSQATRATSSALENVVRQITKAPLPSTQAGQSTATPGMPPDHTAQRARRRRWLWIAAISLLVLTIIALI